MIFFISPFRYLAISLPRHFATCLPKASFAISLSRYLAISLFFNENILINWSETE
jgi:hypothetical protein